MPNQRCAKEPTAPIDARVTLTDSLVLPAHESSDRQQGEATVNKYLDLGIQNISGGRWEATQWQKRGPLVSVDLQIFI